MKFNLKKFKINWEKLESNMEVLFRKHKIAICNLVTEDKKWYSISIIAMDKEKNKKLRIISGNRENDIIRKTTITASTGTLESLLRIQMDCENYIKVCIHPIK